MHLLILILFIAHFSPFPLRFEPVISLLQLLIPILALSNLGRGLPFPLAVGFGQCVLFAYVLLRSGLNHLLGVELPISWIELILICLVPKVTFKVPWAFLLGLFVFCQRELPRELMLSSDPDQHAFFAKQLLDFGFLPLNRGLWGEEGFNYPGGFAVLNFIWAKLSFCDPRDIVTIQPYIQFLLAIFLFSKDRLPGFLLFLVFTFIPYGYLENNYHLEGTGRLSSIFLLSLCLISPKSQKEWFLVTLAPIMLFIINPPFGVLSGALVGVKLIKNLKIIPIIFCLGLILVFCDPYFRSRISGDLNEATLIKTEQKPLELDKYSSNVLSSRSINLTKDMIFKNGYFTLPIWGLALFALLLLFSNKNEGLNLLWQGGVIVLSFLLFQPLFSILGSDPRYFLLEPYLLDSGKLMFLLILIKGTGVIFSKIKFSGLHLALAILLMFIPNKTKPRFSYCGAAGCLTENDKKVIEQMTQYLTDKNTRVLIPNAPVMVFNREKWLFPWGAGRALPFETDVPLAFFYFQGDRDYSYENYQKNICEELNIEWLKAEQIKYIFIPSDRGGTCIRSGGEILFKSGDAKFVKVYE